MWYMLAPASRASRSITSAIVVCCEHLRAAAAAASAKTPSASRPERAVEQLDDLEHGHLRGVAREAVAALDAALGADDAGAAQHGEQLLEELHRHLAPARQLADRHRVGAAAAPELGEREHRIRRLARDRDHRAFTARC